MTDTADLRRRVRWVLDVQAGAAVYAPAVPLHVEACHLHGEPVPFREAVGRPFEPFPVGSAWGGAWDTTWFRLSGTVPPEWHGKQVVAVVDLGYHAGVGFGAEALAYDADGRPITGLSPRHRTVRVTAQPGERVELYVEAAANPPPIEPVPVPETDFTGEPLYRLERAELAARDEAMAELVADLRVLSGLEAALPPDSARAAEIRAALQTVVEAFDPRRPDAARAVVRPLLDVVAAESALTLHAVGNAHIDTAWLWPYREARRKIARTLSTALDLMTDHHDYRFAVSQAQLLAWAAEDHPDLIRRLRQRVADGRIDVVGAGWVEFDANLPAGESLARQLVEGRRWILDNIGTEPEELWLPDSFGYSAGLPGLAAHAGIRHVVTQKLSWNDTNRFPHSTFWWQGLNGDRVLAHFLPADTYNGEMRADELRYAETSFRQQEVLSRALYLYGYGDGGGGPTREMLADARRFASLGDVPRVVLSSPREYLRAVEAQAPRAELPVWVGELYLEKHRGTYTSQARLKRANRRMEGLLREAELWSVASGAPYPVADLQRLWRTLLLLQFHDVLPGSSIGRVYRETHAMVDDAAAVARKLADDARAAIAADVDTAGMTAPVVVFDAAPGGRDSVVETDPVSGVVPGPGVQTSPTGRWLFRTATPPNGWVAVDLATILPPDRPVHVEDGPVLDNGLLRVTFAADTGLVTSVRDVESDREVLRAPGNVLQLFRDEPAEFDAWDLDASYAWTRQDVTDLDEMEVVATGPVRASVQIVRRFGRSTVTQTVSLDAGSRLVAVDVDADWHEDHRLLKVALPVDVHADDAAYEVQWGMLHRPAHASTSWDAARFEVAAQRWAALSEPGYTVGLLNDGRYGYDVRHGVLRLSLLRAPSWPDPTADRGRHHVRYALLCVPAGLRDGRITEQAAAFDLPAAVVAAQPSTGTRPTAGSVVDVDMPGVLVSAVKPAEDGAGVAVRMYEAYGARGRATVGTSLPLRAWQRTDLYERPLQPPQGGDLTLHLRPFEIATVVLRGE